MNKPTPNQQKAIGASGNLLVVAGAGAGKTRTLVQRCIAWLLNEKNPGSLDEILMVTFTEAAAVEMRKRIRETLEEKLRNAPENFHLAEQLALLDIAQISTLHSFCFQLVREHFYELGLDPQVSVLPDETAKLLARDTMDSLLEEIYAGNSAEAEAGQRLVLEQGRGWDKPIRELVQRLHAYTQTLPNPDGWFAEQLDSFNQTEPKSWERWLIEELVRLKNFWLPILHSQELENVVAQRCAVAFARFSAEPTRAEAAAIFETILEADKQWPPRKKNKFREPIEDIFEEATFLKSLCVFQNGIDPLAQDWDWIKPQIIALLKLTQQFTERFAKAKREMAGLDFHDLEQFSLKLLWNNDAQSLTAAAKQWRKKFRLIFVDEYQDINAAQDAILKALAREGNEANRFLVGDVKQSIYRFRLANPRIFLDYEQSWNDAVSGQVIPLSDNFRSHEAILNFVNPLFATLMKKSVGGVDYDESAKLHFGNRDGRSALTVAADNSSRVELHLRITGETEDDSEMGSDLESLSATEKEARLVGRRLLELKTQCAPVWKNGKQEPVQWSDMVILLRSPRNKAEAYAKEFARFGIPLSTSRGGFYNSLEVADLLNLLRLLDNPLQDLPLLAVLRSPLVTLSLDELATIRATYRQTRFWTALLRWHEIHSKPESNLGSDKLFSKVEDFLNRFNKWRRATKQMSLSHLLETVLDETHYCDWLLTQPRGGQRRANVERLLELTRQFDSLQGQGLFRFIRFIESQQDAEIETDPANGDAGNAVRLMSIHQSKGLEFPVVVLADLGKPFNFSDLKQKIILDEIYGLCPQVMPPNTRQTYPSLPYWLAQRRQKIETLGEELRLLYVATTRAIDRLILVGTASSKAFGEKWPSLASRNFDVPEISNAINYLDWLGPWFFQNIPELAGSGCGQNPLMSWTIYGENDLRLLVEDKADSKSVLSEANGDVTPEILAELESRISWRYSFQNSTTEPAKTSVSALRRRTDENDDEAKKLFEFRGKPSVARNVRGISELSAAEIGTAHHTFLELVSLSKVVSESELKLEAERLQQNGILSAKEVASVHFAAIAAFWNSEVGQKILGRAGQIRREHPFTARLIEIDFTKLNLVENGAVLTDEFVVLQGVIDIAVILPSEIWLLDFKTDQITKSELTERAQHYRLQVALYADAMSKIYNRPVTQRWLHFLALQKTVNLTAD
ncbi:MAG: helicase-exonuclease AddAB subunit AddA [Verrucomicrobiota bacterium]